MTTIQYANKAQLQQFFDELTVEFEQEKYPSHARRKAVLKQLKAAVVKHEGALYEALQKDYGYRSEFDSLIADILPTLSLIKYALKHLKLWMKPSGRHSGLLLLPSKVKVHYQPLGVVGVITPWNFPTFLALGPAIQAIAAGNRVMIKLSEFTPHTNGVLRSIVSGLSDWIRLIEGEADIGARFSQLPFDHLFFTGSTNVGRTVAKAAAENLTPVTLELGGKSPTVVDKNYDTRKAVDAILFGKTLNAGQICVSPDYVFVHKSKVTEFIDCYLERYRKYYLQDKNQNKQSHIISERQYQRLQTLIKDAKTKNAKIYKAVDTHHRSSRLVYPYVITDVSDDMMIMQQEIFGSILPVVAYEDIDEVIEYINARPRPLALYVMSNNARLIRRFVTETHSGGCAVNDTIMHVVADDAPFGGVGNSGSGQYHGLEGFLTFSKAKTVLYSKSWLPRSWIMLTFRDLIFRVVRTLFLR